MAIKRYALTANGDVFVTAEFDDATEQGAKTSSYLSSDPKVVPIPENLDVVVGWTWDGTNFKSPE
jgi:hypothetical protein